jgi:hypothetical protein
MFLGRILSSEMLQFITFASFSERAQGELEEVKDFCEALAGQRR